MHTDSLYARMRERVPRVLVIGRSQANPSPANCLSFFRIRTACLADMRWFAGITPVWKMSINFPEPVRGLDFML
jgi:hypothetical protein